MTVSTVKERKELGQFLRNRTCVTPKELDCHLLSFKKKSNGIACESFLIRTTNQEILEREFIDFIHDHIIFYALPYSDTHPDLEHMSEQAFREYQKRLVRLTAKADSLFVTKLKNTGELGELFLFVLLESKGIVQLLNKIDLKTSHNHHFNGLDAVHIEVDKDNRILTHYGYSKMEKTFSKALIDVRKEIDSTIKDIPKRRREFELVSSHIDNSKFDDFTTQIKKIIDPYNNDLTTKSNSAIAHSIFLGYEWDKLNEPNPSRKKSLVKYHTTFYKEANITNTKKIVDQLKKITNSEKYDFFVYILPVPNLDITRHTFRQVIHALPIEASDNGE